MKKGLIWATSGLTRKPKTNGNGDDEVRNCAKTLLSPDLDLLNSKTGGDSDNLMQQWRPLPPRTITRHPTPATPPMAVELISLTSMDRRYCSFLYQICC